MEILTSFLIVGVGSVGWGATLKSKNFASFSCLPLKIGIRNSRCMYSSQYDYNTKQKVTFRAFASSKDLDQQA